MSPLYDLYQPGSSWLHRLDPRAKMLFVLCSFVTLLTLKNVYLMAAALLLLHVMLFSAHILVARIAWVWRMTLPTMIMIALFWVIFTPGQGPVILSWWFVEITAESIAEGVGVALRIGSLAFVFSVLLFTTSQAELVRGLVALGLPFEWGLTIAMALRFLPTMAGVFGMIRDAQQARALNMSQSNPLARARAYLPIASAMLISALRTAQNLSYALESRAFGARPRRTYVCQVRYRLVDWLWSVIVLAITGVLLGARLGLGFGQQPLSLL